MTWWYAADAANAAPDSTPWERVLIALVPVLLALIALFEPKVRKRVAGTEAPPADAPAPTSKTVAQTVADASGLQHMLVKDLQRRLDAAESRAEKLNADLDAAQEQIANLRVVVATCEATISTLEAQIARLRAGWTQP